MRLGTSTERTRKVSIREVATSMRPHWLRTVVTERSIEEKATVMIRPAVVMVADSVPIARKMAASVE
eukprot:jgi/Chrpa1/10763/Chrysochromulina_OHIO_Genome00020956-RA